jgi:hypothetical protein
MPKVISIKFGIGLLFFQGDFSFHISPDEKKTSLKAQRGSTEKEKEDLVITHL